MDAGEPDEDISDLEARIEELAAAIESCRKMILAAKIAMTAGGLLLVALVLGAIPFDPAAMIAGMAAAIGGIVVYGSNTSTLQQAAADLNAAEALRAELIGRLDLRMIGAPDV